MPTPRIVREREREREREFNKRHKPLNSLHEMQKREERNTIRNGSMIGEKRNAESLNKGNDYMQIFKL